MTPSRVRPGARDPLEAPLLEPGEVSELLRPGPGGPWSEARVPPLGGRVGDQGARRLGSGLDYAGTRAYQPGDSPRHVHWRASARSGELQVRQYHQDARPSVCVVVDRGPTMRFGTRVRIKAAQGARLALWIAAQEVRAGGEVGALVLEPDPQWLPPAVGVAALQRLAARVAAPAPPLAGGRGSAWSPVLGHLVARLSPGARVYLISDFHAVSDRDRTLFAALGQRFDARALVVYDPAERALPAVGPLVLGWDGVYRAVDGRDAAQRERHAAAWEGHRERLGATFRGAGVVPWLVSTGAGDLGAAVAEGGGGL